MREKDLQAFRDAWMSISTQLDLRTIYEGKRTGYLELIEDAMAAQHGKETTNEMLGNSVHTSPIENQEQQEKLKHLEIVGAGMNLFRSIGKGQLDSVREDKFGQAAAQMLEDHLIIAYAGKITPEELRKKVEVLNQALAGEQTDICSSIAKSPPGLVIMAYPEALIKQDMSQALPKT